MRPRRLLFLFLVPPLLAFAAVPGGGLFAGEKEAEAEALMESDIPVRIVKAEVGEWALYRLANGNRSRLTVVEKWEEYGEEFVLVRNVVTRDTGKRVRVTEERVVLGEAEHDLRTLNPGDKLTTAKVLVHGRTLNTVVISYHQDGVMTHQSYLSDKIPVYGLVKGVDATRKPNAIMTLLDYGFAEEGEE